MKCTLCGECIGACPFGALKVADGSLIADDTCTLCGLCAEACKEGALSLPKTENGKANVDDYRGIVIFAEQKNGIVHPITYELIGSAQKLAAPGEKISCLLIGVGLTDAADELRHYGCDRIVVYGDEALRYYRADLYARAFEQCIAELKPSVVLIGGTDVGKSIAPTLATRFHTGLTADCTELARGDNLDLIQIRPAYGGNIMARIRTPHHRPQFATVRHRVMEPAHRTDEKRGIIIHRCLAPDQRASQIEVIRSLPLPIKEDIANAGVLVALGQGFLKKEDLTMAEELARLLGGRTASSRALVEKGWMPPEKQIGLSGKTVSPGVIITFGVSGSVQFMSGMRGSKLIIAVNLDPNAPIFSIAHVPICADLYEILPRLIRRLA